MPTPDALLGLRFDTVAEQYHTVRPRYPEALWEALLPVTGLQPGARVLEIGAGTGIATAALVRRGLHVTALEPGAAMAAIIARELGPTGLVDVRVGTFDALDWTGEPFDLVIGATSLHWIEREALNARLPGLVRPGGFAALVYYEHVAGGDTAFFEAAQRCYEIHAPEIAHWGGWIQPEDVIPAATAIDALPGFVDTHRERWLHDVPSDRAHYLALLSTYSGHLALAPAARERLLACIGELIDRDFGGRITKRYRIELVVRRCVDA